MPRARPESLASSAMCACTAGSAASARRSRSLPIQLCPLDASITASVAAGSSPRCCASASASAAPARLMAASRLLTSLVRAPSPGVVPMRNSRVDRSRSSGCQCSKTASAQATIRLIVPSRARGGPPDIGASMQSMPWTAQPAAQSSTVCGASVGHSSTAEPRARPRAPRRARRTAPVRSARHRPPPRSAAHGPAPPAPRRP